MFSQAHKFGGASLANVVRIKNAVDIISELPNNRMHVVVVSAALGVADQLNDIIHVDEMRELKLETLRNQQLRLMEELVSDTEYRQLSLSFLLDIAILRLQLRIFAGNEDALAALGEDWSARLLCAALRDRGLNAQVLDPTTFLKVDPEGRFIDERVSREDFLRQHNGAPIVVVPGGLAVDDQGRSFSLGHKGTDLSASLVASLLGVDELHIWTDIEGVRTGDPDYVKNSRLLPYLSYREARCFLDNSTGVLHKNTLDQVEKKGIPVIVRSSIKPDGGKTFIGTTSSGDAWLGLTSRGPYTLVNIPRRISLSSLKQTEFFKCGEIVCLSGSDKLHFLIPQRAGGKLLYQLINLLSGICEDLDITSHLRQITLVSGDGSLSGSEDVTLIRDCPFELSELEISNSHSRYLFIHDHLAPKAMSWLHDRLFKPESRFAVAVVGAGNVGRNLLQQIHDGIEKTNNDYGVLFQIKAVADSS
ncbi:MAG: hypothetical protein M3Q07_18740, partial [Pseudobdellovibrionaceae bacterium]|nr:hypothetical protein [Pseudobdellovibrionaceae bacterium]